MQHGIRTILTVQEVPKVHRVVLRWVPNVGEKVIALRLQGRIDRGLLRRHQLLVLEHDEAWQRPWQRPVWRP